MKDPELIDLETSGGYRPPSGLGERVLVGLAALALVGGALIAVGKVLPESDETADASPTPAAIATVAPSRTPRPRPTPTPFPAAPPQVVVEPGEVPDVVEYPPWVGGWLRAVVDVSIRSAPGVSREVGVLHAGEVAYVSNYGADWPPRWFTIEAPSPGGVIEFDASGERMEFFSQEAGLVPPSVWSLAAGDSGFLAFGSLAARANEMQPPLLAASSDGQHWTQVGDQPRAQWLGTAAWGPAGWLAVNAIDTPQGAVPWVWRSADGVEWDSLGGLSDLGGRYPGQLAAAGNGYLTFVSSDTSERVRAWFSEDGELWEERPVPPSTNGRNGQPNLVGLPVGFFAWSDNGDYQRGARDAGGLAFSPNGWDWTVVEGGPRTSGLHLTVVGNEVRAVANRPGSVGSESWVGVVEGSNIRWFSDPQQQTFDGRGVVGLASDGQRAMAVGWDLSSGEVVGWSMEDGPWRQVRVPARAEDGFPFLLAGGAHGFVLVGANPSLRSTNPVAWYSADARTWSSKPVPLVPHIGDPDPSECHPLTTMDAVIFATMDRIAAIVCLGDTPLTFRAYSAECEGCYGGWPGVVEPDWLANPMDNKLFLSPIENEGYFSEAVVDPALTVTPEWRKVWVELTGHFDDPAAMDCRWIPGTVISWNYWGSTPPIVTTCRQQFVVTAVKVVDGP